MESDVSNVLKYSYFYNGGGVAVGDIDNDGLPDVLFTGNMVPNRLYLNRGNLTFEDVTEKSGVAGKQGWCTGAVMVDVNHDGMLDIYICRSGDADPVRRKNLLYINKGGLQFSEEAEKYGLADKGYSTQASFFDYDRDGDLDMFLINHSLQEYAGAAAENVALRKQRQPEFASKLYRNDGGLFIDVSNESGIISNVLTFGLGVAVSDLNNDGWPDVYVSNDFNEPDYLFINNRDGTFREDLAACMDEVSLYSMGSDAADFNNDGLPDIVTLDMLPEDNYGQKMHNGAENFDKFRMLYDNGFYYQSSRNMLHRNNGDGSFSEIGQYAGVAATDWSWAALFADFDNDGHKDLFVTNGYVRDYTNMDFMKYSMDKAMREQQGEKQESISDYISKMPSIFMSNYLFRNNGNYTFQRNNDEWGIDELNVSSGAAYADLDNDGDLDLIVSNINQTAGVYRNNCARSADGNFVKIKLAGPPKNSYGIGAKVTVYCADQKYYQEQFPVRGFQSSVDPVLNFGLGVHSRIDSVIVLWPDEHWLRLTDMESNQTIAADWHNSQSFSPPIAIPPDTFFNADTLITYIHEENEYNDFAVQTLLPDYLSREGPCVATGDVNGDGRVDVFIGSPKGQLSRLYRQNEKGNFEIQAIPSIASDSMSEDVCAVFFDADTDGDLDLYVGSGGYEFSENDPILQDRLYINSGKGEFRKTDKNLPEMLTASACVKPHDIDGDGDLDLFVGGRGVPGKYPVPGYSRILINIGNGVFEDRTTTVAPGLSRVGMVTDAVWTDVTEDGLRDLVVVGEWMNVEVYATEDGATLKNITSSMIHFPAAGWWNCISAADMDEDGDEDLILGNRGLNNIFRADINEPLNLYYDDFDMNGSIDPVFGYYIQGKLYPAPSRDDLTDQLPVLRKKFLEYHTYSRATMEDVFTPQQLQDAATLKITTTSSMFLENRGKKGLISRELPLEVQWSPIHAIETVDVNGDGHTDLILAGNNTWSRPKFGKYRANHGLVLIGNGQGKFQVAEPLTVGLNLRGNIRDLTTFRVNNHRRLLAGVNGDRLLTYRLHEPE